MVKKLDEYNRKRNFDKTFEPEGKTDGTGVAADEPAGTIKAAGAPEEPAGTIKAAGAADEPAGTIKAAGAAEEPAGTIRAAGAADEPAGLLRFVVQHHIASRDHFDFRLEWDGALLSWAVPKGPSYDTRDKRLAVQVEDHPLDYRNFEGTIPKGEYGGGTVMLWDEGYWEPQNDVDKGLADGSLKFVLNGQRLKGKWALVRIKAKDGDTKNNWLLLKERDEYVKTSDGISEFTDSIRTGRTMKEIEDGENEKINIISNPFEKTGVQLAKLVNKLPEGDDWLYELKYDGYRIVAYLEGSNVRLITRNGKDYTEKFRDIAYSLVNWAGGRAMVLDGEMVITDAQGKTDFQALQNYMKNPRGKNLTYIIFDLLALNGEDLRGHRLYERKEALEALMKNCPKNLYYSKHVKGNGKASFQAACDANMEGIVGKKADSVYNGTRSGGWIKLKCDTRQEFVIGGYTLSDKKTSGISSLLLGVYEGEELIYAGRAGTGFTERSMKELEKKFESIRVDECPFKQLPDTKKGERITWLRPVLVAEIKFAEWTDENLLRQASYKGLRVDKEAKDVRREGQGNEFSDDVSPEDESHDRIQHEGKIQINERKDSRKQTGEQTDKQMGEQRDKQTGEQTDKQTGEQRDEQAGEQTDKQTDEQTDKQAGDMPQDRKLNMDITVTRNGKNLFIGGIKITNPDRVIFEDPEIRKAEVVQYYAKVAGRMMPYMGNRILSVIRCHKGITETCFFKKHPGADNKGIVTISVMNSSGENKEYFYVENVNGLISEAQMGTLEFHTWGSSAQDVEKPDMMVFDLDPDEGMGIERVRSGVRDIKSILDQLSLVSFLKTSGGKGYHVVVPFVPSADWDTFSGFARQIAEIMERKWPDRYTSNIRKEKRRNKIFIDWIRNGRGATSIAPYSLRARKGALVSMPITWEELDTVAPDGVNMAAALKRIEGNDPWKDFLSSDQRLK